MPDDLSSSRPSIPDDSAPREKAGLADYVAMARPDHWPKHIFILPGIALAYILHPMSSDQLVLPIGLGLIAACAIASANYVLNEWLDLAFDRFHPIKSQRPAVQKDVSGAVVMGTYAALAILGLGLGTLISPLVFATLTAFLVSGLIYNVRPLRTKDRAYLDVVSEAINNPIRLTLGWAMVWPATLPPSSLLLAYWMGGAFLMAVKRFAEYRSVEASVGLDRLHLYRRSFRDYTENRLLVSAFLYAQMAAFFLAVFLIKYRIEYLLAIPLFALLFAVYLRLGLKHESTAQAPERLFGETLLMTVVGLLVAALAILTWIDIPSLGRLSEPHYVFLGQGSSPGSAERKTTERASESEVQRYLEKLEHLADRPGPAAGSEPERRAVERFKQTLSDFKADDFRNRLRDTYAESLYFNDTLTTLTSRAELENHMIKTAEALDSGEVEFLDFSRSDQDFYFRWEMCLRLKNLDPENLHCTVGMSHVRFDSDGRVILHQDFWDAASGFFEHVPILGWGIRRVKKGL